MCNNRENQRTYYSQNENFLAIEFYFDYRRVNHIVINFLTTKHVLLQSFGTESFKRKLCGGKSEAS